MKKIIITLALLIFIPINVSAKEENMEVVAETTKYYKTIENKSNQLMKAIPITIEVSEEEYDSYNLDLDNDNSKSSTTETNYKK